MITFRSTKYQVEINQINNNTHLKPNARLVTLIQLNEQ